MKKILVFMALIFVLASCTGKEKEVVISTLTEEDTISEIKEEVKEEKELVENLENEIKKIEEEIGEIEEIKEEVVSSEGQYTAYSEELVKTLAGDKVLFFHATWCPSCKSADTNFLKSEFPNGLNILKLDYDTNTDLRKKYGVLAQHTFVLVDAKGEMIKKWAGGRTVEDILDAIK